MENSTNVQCGKCAGTGCFNKIRQQTCYACKGTGIYEGLGRPANATVAMRTARLESERLEAIIQAAKDNGIEAPRLALGHFLFMAAKPASRNPEHIYIKHDGEYLGKLKDGVLTLGPPMAEELLAELRELIVDPGESAKAYGLRTGKCSCCGRTLTNHESIDLGIGPICRAKYGI